VKWFQKAADQGYAYAQFNLAISFEHGTGNPKNNIQAHKWFNIATSLYPATDKASRDQAVAGRDRVAQLMTPEQIAEAQKLAREWKPKSPAQ